MQWLKEIFIAIGNILSPMVGGSFRKENRADFMAVTDMWNTLSNKLEKRVGILEDEVAACKKEHMQEVEKSLEMQAKVNELDGEIVRLKSKHRT